MADDLVPLRLCPLSCALWSATQKRSGWPGTEPGQPAVGLCDDMEHLEHFEDPFDVEQKIQEELAEQSREAEVEQAREAEDAEEYGEGAAAGPDAVMEVPSSATTAAAVAAQVDLKTVQSLAADHQAGATAGPDAVMEVPSSATTVAAAQPAQVDLKRVQSLAADHQAGAAAGPDAVMEVPSSATTAAAVAVQVDQRTVQSLAADHQAALINETSAKTASADALEAKKTADEKKKRAYDAKEAGFAPPALTTACGRWRPVRQKKPVSRTKLQRARFHGPRRRGRRRGRHWMRHARAKPAKKRRRTTLPPRALRGAATR